MKLSAEITMYPLQDDYLPAIKAIIDKLNTYEGLNIETFPSTTLIVGDYDEVMAALGDAMKWSVEACGKAVFVTKFLPNTELLSDQVG
jgi:uncharacterized protein YqgV (UPF0045/DUF77 family)